MKRFAALLLTLSLALSLSACKKADDQPAPDAPGSAAPTEVETPAEGFTTNVYSVPLDADSDMSPL